MYFACYTCTGSHDFRARAATTPPTDAEEQTVLKHKDIRVVHGVFVSTRGGMIDLDEFVSGCMQLHGPAKSLQMAQMSHENKITRQVPETKFRRDGAFCAAGRGRGGRIASTSRGPWWPKIRLPNEMLHHAALATCGMHIVVVVCVEDDRILQSTHFSIHI